MRKVFLSSTSRDLAEYRAAVTDAIHGLGGDYHCIRMEDFGARDWQAAEFCAAQVHQCDLFVGILGHLYGSCPEGVDRSYTEQEYDTAEELGLPRLMFVAPDDLPLPTNLREPDDKWQRQQHFRRRVSQILIRGTFKSPQELAARVVQAIRNWEQEQPASEMAAVRSRWADPSRISQERGPQLGTDVHRMCDRTEQEADFVRFFSAQLNQREGWPQIYLLPAAEEECPESLIKRFQISCLSGYARHKWGEQRGVVGEKMVEWPSGHDLEERIQRLQVKLFSQFAPSHRLPGDFSAAVFKRILAEEPANILIPIVTVRHNIMATGWSEAEKKLLERYLQFWDEVGAQSPPQQFLVFLNILHPAQKQPDIWQKLFRSAATNRKRLADDLQEICEARRQVLNQTALSLCPTLLLEVLSSIRPHHVRDWFSQHNIYDDEEIRSQKCQEIFQATDCRPMKEVEGKLKIIVNEFIKQKGYA